MRLSVMYVALLSALSLGAMDDQILTHKLYGFTSGQKLSASSLGQLLHDALTSGQKEALQAVLQLPALDLEIPNQRGDTVLLRAIRNAQQELVQLLLDNGARADAINMLTGTNALHLIAAEHGRIPLAATWALRVSDETLQRLINQKSIKGSTPLHIAITHQFIEMVTWLLDHGADPCLGDAGDNNALHLAAATNNIVIVQLLLAHLTKKVTWPALNKECPNLGGSMVVWPTHALDAYNAWGNTPLHIAAGYLNEEMYSLLLDYRAHPLLVNHAGQTPSAIKLQGTLKLKSSLLHAALAPDAEDDEQQSNESEFDSGTD